MAKSKSKLSTEKKKAWDAFSRYIRLRDCLKTTGDLSKGSCITCNKLLDFKKLQAGHLISGRNNSVLFDEEIVNAQCLTEDSNLRMFNGANKSISNIKVGDRLWAFNEQTYDREYAIVENIETYVPDTLYRVETENGVIFYATPDHKVVANGKWVRIDEMLHNVSAYDILEL